MKTKAFSRLLYGCSGLWLVAAGCFPHKNSDDTPLILAAILLPLLVGLLIARYPWVLDPAAPVPPGRKAALGLLVAVSALWLTYSAFFLTLFFSVTLISGWE